MFSGIQLASLFSWFSWRWWDLQQVPQVPSSRYHANLTSKAEGVSRVNTKETEAKEILVTDPHAPQLGAKNSKSQCGDSPPSHEEPVWLGKHLFPP